MVPRGVPVSVALQGSLAGVHHHALDTLSIRPETFADILCDEVGFRFVRSLETASAASSGFQRSMMLLRRPG